MADTGIMPLFRPAPARATSPSPSPSRACIRDGARGPFTPPSTSSTAWRARPHGGRQRRLADYLTRLDFVVLDELRYLPFAQTGGQLLFHLISRLYERTSVIVTTNLGLRRMAGPRRCEAHRCNRRMGVMAGTSDRDRVGRRLRARFRTPSVFRGKESRA